MKTSHQSGEFKLRWGTAYIKANDSLFRTPLTAYPSKPSKVETSLIPLTFRLHFGDIMSDDYQAPVDISLREVTISAFTDTGQSESLITVPLQRVYTGRKPVISSRLADTPCAAFDVSDLLDILNDKLRTSYSLDTPSLSSLLKDCINKNYNFGMAYGLLRHIWYTNNWSTVQDELHKWEEDDQEINRVVPWWSMGISVSKQDWGNLCQPISHAWMEEKDRVNMWTPINGYDWPVPIPKDANLDLIRIEMLNLGAEYAWLDVLCLRQVHGRGEDLRTEEWKLDVPTIGAVYRCSIPVVCYLSGLGLPLNLKDGDLDSDQCWFRRAWILQEVGRKRVIAGDTPDGPLHEPIDEDGNYETELLTRFHKHLKSMDYIFYGNMFSVLKDMQNRVSTNPVDKVAGLTFSLRSKRISAYDETQSLEEAWTELVNTMDADSRGKLFYQYPEPGNAGAKWRPSWDQVMTQSLLIDKTYSNIKVERNEMDEDWSNTECIETGLVQGLAAVEGNDRHGKLIVKDKDGIELIFNIMAIHKHPIPDDTYTLIYFKSSQHGSMSLLSPVSPLSICCVIGQRLPGKMFEKLSTFRIIEKRSQRNISKLPTEQCQYILV
ncbi:hypothetical protein ARMSODRAFT_1039539 [Armillaria solidipes]|uniref:Heterokaryon incompatibility domain-containing protein n=1 Tax=Armillaria solidipes TaxID=1076256 RepID=A0A2H3BGJ2_9AGAR|nr:hypothetical protein ARMSODRAFT_1039539 [Armillaria solidipes]